ncbi:MAG: anion transporter [Alphaproteobacteria bacterium]|nr:anion transporter [Alphaproteobacteria bacterium]
MTALILAVFVATYIGMALGRVPGLRLDRTGIALMAVALLLAAGAIDLSAMGRAIDAPTILLLFALMILSAQFGQAGFYDLCAARITSAALSPRMLLALTILISGGLSAVLANDIVVFAMTPLLCIGLGRRGLDPRPFLMGLAGASNAGSAATLIGNPQNILIGQLGGLDFWTFLMVCGPPALVSLVVVHLAVASMWRRELRAAPMPALPLPAPAADRTQVLKGLLAALVLVGLFATPMPREIGALAIAALLLASRRMASRAMIGAVDWHLLLLFACLFTVTAAFAATGIAEGGLEWLKARGLWPDRLLLLAPLSLVASNTIGNVPAVILLMAIWEAPPEGALYGLALLSTLAGNLLLVGSLANIIVAERAEASGVRLGFADFARAGIPMALLSMALAVIWLGLGGWMPWF